jgi:hypothetical protein
MLKEIWADADGELVRSDFACNFVLKFFGQLLTDYEQIAVA